MRLSLTGAERQALADVGVIADDRGFLHSAGSGREVAPAVAVQILKGVPDPSDYQRGYLTYGHSADSPAVTGQRATVPMPETHPAWSQDFRRGWLADDHQAESPDDRGDSGPPADSPAAEVYASAARTLAENVANATGAALEPSVVPSQAASPTAARVQLPADLCAASVPRLMQVQATKPAPGERP